jgi:hypothetical protein
MQSGRGMECGHELEKEVIKGSLVMSIIGGWVCCNKGKWSYRDG